MVKVMIVDDEELERHALSVIINKCENIEIVAQAKNGKEAIELDEKFNPEIIIMDAKMPGIDGRKAANIIKQQNKDKIVIMMMVYDDFELIHDSLISDINEYILKPIKPSDLIDIIDKFIVNLKTNDNLKKGRYTKDKKDLSISASIEYIDNNLGENVSLEQVASICNLSPCYFSKVFKKEVGVNFISYVNDKKINRAKEILETTDNSIINIAIDLGYEDCGYFIRVFKKLQGVTPKKYRELYRYK
ncbi:response regulator [Paraclostridium ghonii]|uniref:Stage 0 sporulation protein A homolog n=1 Tax=Paraclostridium ghonii TaxID=29358 RepID=A0ABU0MZM0_9FIRM|nr:response regulator [Paeniclostridium ghonii]MDQ0556316.1 YesN/AraC family two-component response regulator [Paeniclostridium ghonii]